MEEMEAKRKQYAAGTGTAAAGNGKKDEASGDTEEASPGSDNPYTKTA